MPNKLEEELRGVQRSIVEIKKILSECSSKNTSELEETLISYYEKEQQLLEEIGNGGI